MTFAALVAAQSMIFGLAVNLSPPEGTTRWVIHGLLALSAVVVFALVGLPLVREAWGALRAGRIVVEQFFLTGIFGAFAASVFCTVSGVGSVYYEVVAILLAIYTFSQLVMERQRRQIAAAVDSLADVFEWCHVPEADGTLRWVRADEIKPGQIVVVRPGEAISVDGVIRDGTAFVQETTFTGELAPVVKRAGDHLLAGSFSIDGLLRVEASLGGAARRLDGHLARVRDAQNRPTPLQSEADRLTRWFLPTVLLLSAGTFFFWLARGEWLQGLFNALAVVVVACPCAMGLATPLAVWSALLSLAQRGLIVREAGVVEKMAAVDTVVFDKTGTLGDERLNLVDLVVSQGVDRVEIRRYLAALEGASAHPIAEAFRLAGDLPTVSDVTFRGGIGLAGNVEGVSLQIGNSAILTAEHRPEAAELAAALRGSEAGTQTLFVLLNDRLAAAACIGEKLKGSVAATLRELEAMGIRCLVLTGDPSPTGAARDLPIEVASGLTAEQKAERVAQLQARGQRVLFVGDGINDTTAMIGANVALAMGHGSALAREIASAEWVGEDLLVVPFAIRRSRQAVRTIRGNLAFAVCYNVIGMALAATGFIHPIVAALLMMGSSATVTWRALRSVSLSETSLARHSRTIPVSRWLAFLCLLWALQGPLLGWLGGFSRAGVCVLAGIFASAAGVTFWSSRRRPWTAPADLLLSMIGLGGFVMLLGWWGDAGFHPIVHDAVCACGCFEGSFGFAHFVTLRWMDIGMLAATAGCLWQQTRGKSFSWRNYAFSAMGMLAGMKVGAIVVGSMHLSPAGFHFLAMFSGMVIGMCLGMFLGDAVGLWFARWGARRQGRWFPARDAA